MNKISIEIPSLPENIQIVESFIDNVKEKYYLNDDIYGNIMVSVTEAVNNAINHGNQNDPAKRVFLSVFFTKPIIKFKIVDEGGGFQYENLPDPTAPDNLEKLGGRGVFLMKSLADEVLFSENGKMVELIFYVL